MSDCFELKKLTNRQWANLYDVTYKDKNAREKHWTVASRKDKPIVDAPEPDAVVIVPFIETAAGTRLVVTKEFRVPIWDYEYGFPAGLIEQGETVEQTIHTELRQETGLELAEIKHISPPIYSSSGLTDESCVMAIVQARGQVSDAHLEDSENIEVLLMDVDDIKDLLSSGKKISAKAWGLLYHYAEAGKIC